MAQYVAVDAIQDYVGYEAPPTDWHTVTQEQIDRFADCTLDHQFIHVDPAKASMTPFGTTIAHGFLSLSLLSYFAGSFAVLVDGTAMAINAGFDKVRFVSPVKVNSRIRAHARIDEFAENKPGQFRQKTSVTVEIEGEEAPALVAEWISVQWRVAA